MGGGSAAYGPPPRGPSRPAAPAAPRPAAPRRPALPPAPPRGPPQRGWPRPPLQPPPGAGRGGERGGTALPQGRRGHGHRPPSGPRPQGRLLGPTRAPHSQHKSPQEPRRPRRRSPPPLTSAPRRRHPCSATAPAPRGRGGRECACASSPPGSGERRAALRARKAGGQRGVSRCGAAMEDDAPVIYGLEFQVGAGGGGRGASRWRRYLREGGGCGARGGGGGARVCGGARGVLGPARGEAGIPSPPRPPAGTGGTTAFWWFLAPARRVGVLKGG